MSRFIRTSTNRAAGGYMFLQKGKSEKVSIFKIMEELLPDMRDFDEREQELYSRMINKRGTIRDARILKKMQEKQ